MARMEIFERAVEHAVMDGASGDMRLCDETSVRAVDGDVSSATPPTSRPMSPRAMGTAAASAALTAATPTVAELQAELARAHVREQREAVEARNAATECTRLRAELESTIAALCDVERRHTLLRSKREFGPPPAVGLARRTFLLEQSPFKLALGASSASSPMAHRAAPDEPHEDDVPTSELGVEGAAPRALALAMADEQIAALHARADAAETHAISLAERLAAASEAQHAEVDRLAAVCANAEARAAREAQLTASLSAALEMAQRGELDAVARGDELETRLTSAQTAHAERTREHERALRVAQSETSAALASRTQVESELSAAIARIARLESALERAATASGAQDDKCAALGARCAELEQSLAVARAAAAAACAEATEARALLLVSTRDAPASDAAASALAPNRETVAVPVSPAVVEWARLRGLDAARPRTELWAQLLDELATTRLELVASQASCADVAAASARATRAGGRTASLAVACQTGAWIALVVLALYAVAVLDVLTARNGVSRAS